MSSLRRTIRQMDYEMRDKKIPKWIIISDAIADVWSKIKDKLGYYEVRAFCQNLPFFLKAAWKFRTWDSSYNINLFADSLELTAKTLKGGHALLAEKQYRRCMTASGLLRRAYDGRAIDDKSLHNWMKRNSLIWRKLDRSNLYEMDTESVDTKDYADKMWKIIQKRRDALEKSRKEEAWAYIHKWVEHFWD